MNIKEQEIIEKHISEASTADYGKVSTAELKDLLGIFKNVHRSAAKPVIAAITRELDKRIGEDVALEEAKVVPFKKLEQAWTRTNGDKDKQAKLIKKHDLKKIISSVRPGEIKLGVKNKLMGTTKGATAAGLDLDDQLIFITNNPLKIIYPKKSTRRPEGEEIKESKVLKDVKTLRFEKVVSLTINEDCEEVIESFISEASIESDSTPAQIREAYKSFNLSEAAADHRKLKTSNKLSSAEYEKFGKLKAFNSKDWKWNSKEGLYHRVNESTDLEEGKFYKPKINRESETITFINDAEAKQAEKLFTSLKLKVKRSAKRISFINTAEFKSAKSKIMESTDLDERKKSKFDLEKEYKDLTGKKMPAGTSLTAMQVKINMAQAQRAKKEETELEEASASDIKKVLASAKKAGGDVKGNQIDFGMGAVIDVSIEKGKIKLDAGKSNGVEYFNNVKDAIMAFESVELEEAFMRLPGNIINNELYAANRALGELLNSQTAGNDFDAKRLNMIIKSLNDVKKSAKKFNNPEEVPLSFQYKKK